MDGLLAKLALAALAAAVLLVLAFLLLGRERSLAFIAGPADPGPYDFAGSPRRASGNDALACTPGGCAAPDMSIAEDFPSPGGAVESLGDRLRAIEPRIERVDDGSDAAYRRFVVRSRWMRFPDTVDISALEEEGRVAVRIYSRSRLGRSDFGVNRRRLETLLRSR